MSITRIIGIFFIIFGLGGGLWLAFGNLGFMFPALLGKDMSLIVGGGFVGLMVVGILMIVGESDSRG